METEELYRVDRSLVGKARRRIVRLMTRRPARLSLDRPMISFTFDDPPASAADRGASILEQHGLRGTYFVAAGLAASRGPAGLYASQPSLMALADAGHELACHTYTHLDCAKASAQAIIDDVARNREAFAAWGAPPASAFAYPYGEISLTAKRALGGEFRLLRALHPGVIETGSDLNQAPSVGVEGSRGEAHALKWLDRAAERKAWLILYTHDVVEQPSQWGCTPRALIRLVETALQKDFDVVTIAEGAKRLG